MVTKNTNAVESPKAKRPRKPPKACRDDPKEWDKVLVDELGRCASCGSRCHATVCRRCDHKIGPRCFVPDRRLNGEGFDRYEPDDDDTLE